MNGNPRMWFTDRFIALMYGVGVRSVQRRCNSPVNTTLPEDAWLLSVASIVTVMAGNASGDTPDHSVT